MVFTVHGNKFHRLAQYLQRIIQLDTFTDRHVCIYRACSNNRGVLILSALNNAPCFVNKSGLFQG